MNEQDYSVRGVQMYIPRSDQSPTPTQTTLSQMPNPERTASQDICMAIATYSSIHQISPGQFFNRSVTNVGKLHVCEKLPTEEILKIGKACVGLSNKLESAEEISLSGYFSPPNTNPAGQELVPQNFISNMDSPYDTCLRSNFSKIPAPAVGRR